MNLIGKFATGLVAVAASGAIILASTSAGSQSPDRSATIGATADGSQSRAEPFNYAREFVRWTEEPAPANAR
jgi:hypothetical protein